MHPEQDKPNRKDRVVVVVGGGIAGISCIEALCLDYDVRKPQYNTIKLISKSRLVKRVRNYESRGRNIESFDVNEEDSDDIGKNLPHGLRFELIVAEVTEVQSLRKEVIIRELDSPKSSVVAFDVLCICSGSKPRQLQYNCPNIDEIENRILVIRDTHTVDELKKKLLGCKRLVVVGNGGIGLELIYKISNCQKVWVIRDESIGASYFDPGAAKFLLDCWQSENAARDDQDVSRSDYHTSTTTNSSTLGPSLGPGWSRNICLKGSTHFTGTSDLEICTNDEVVDIIHHSGSHPLKVVTRNGKNFDCDIIVTAIGVEPNLLNFPNSQPVVCNKFGGYLVDEQMRTTIASIYAAGDIVSCASWSNKELWLQMRLWTQARQMGYYAGRCMAAHLSGQDPSIYFNFDCFTHSTKFFGRKLILIGIYNGQQLDGNVTDYEALVRVNKARDYVKVLVGNDGRIKGAVLVGDSGLEETIENLVNDRLDVSSFKERLLDDTVDIEDYFD